MNTREAEREEGEDGNSSHASTDKDLSLSSVGIPGRGPRFDGLACCGVGRGRAIGRAGFLFSWAKLGADLFLPPSVSCCRLLTEINEIKLLLQFEFIIDLNRYHGFWPLIFSTLTRQHHQMLQKRIEEPRPMGTEGGSMDGVGPLTTLVSFVSLVAPSMLIFPPWQFASH